ncbi:SDR family oxidoreductase, partial [Dehalococcoidia bacterium]|nr:SDR family oxidoreductase [Dehalococcoidia bacterium]
MSLQGKIAIVTGAWGMRSVGRSTAQRLARDGADVIVTDIMRPNDNWGWGEREANWAGIESVAQDVRDLGQRSEAIYCDVTKPKEVESLVAETVRLFGGIDILVNTHRALSGSGNPGDGGLLNITEEAWDWTMAVNTRGPMTTSRFVAKEMVKAGKGGSIIHISTMGGKIPKPVGIAYPVSKAGLNMLTHVMAVELAPYGIRVNAVSPGVIDTNRSTPYEEKLAAAEGISYPEYRQRWLDGRAQTIPIGRVSTPDEIASVVAFLASD